MKNKQQVVKRVRRAGYTWVASKDLCLLCGKHWLRACSTHTQEDNLNALALIRQEDSK